ncbi:MAG: AMP-binding protein [Clostridia bacterium]|nr:AMP-binding protein [Clostridia bacterium]
MKKEQLHEKQSWTDLRHLVEWAADTFPTRNAYSYRIKPMDKGIQTVTFTELRDDVRALASTFLKMGVTGKHCTVIGKFSYDWVVTYFSVLSAGGVLVPLDRDWGEKELCETAVRADVSFVFCDSDIAEKGQYICENGVNATPVLLLTDGENSLKALKEEGKKYFEADSNPYFDTELDPDKLALLVFTSGTTGKGKGVMLSQKAVLSDLASIIPYIDFSQKTVGVLPPHHTYGSSVMLIGHAMIGSEIYISSGIRYITKELKEQKPGHLCLVPLYLETFYRKIKANIKEQGKEKLVARMMKISNGLLKIGIDMRSKFFGAIRAAFGGEVKMIISGGAPINPDILHFFEGIGISTLNGYGITECAPIVAVNRSRRSVEGSVGPILDIDEIKIDDPNEDGEGEICVKGSNVMLGYYQDDEATANAMTEDGYFRTGDYGKMEGDVLFITGRKKNLIILSNGKNVYPEEIESEFMATPGVLEIIVYEGQSKRGMEHNQIVAEIYPDKEYLEKNGIEDAYAHLKPYVDNYNRTAVPYKKIGVLKVRTEEFPKNTLRKIMRFKLDMSID